jgi:hypothetical protein
VTTPKTIADRVTAADRTWFDANPGVQSFVRAFVPGEMPACALLAAGVTLTDATTVLVKRIAPGVRSRVLFDPWRSGRYAA